MAGLPAAEAEQLQNNPKQVRFPYKQRLDNYTTLPSLCSY